MSDDLRNLTDEFLAKGWRRAQTEEAAALLIQVARETHQLAEATADASRPPRVFDKGFARRALAIDLPGLPALFERLDARMERMERKLDLLAAALGV